MRRVFPYAPRPGSSFHTRHTALAQIQRPKRDRAYDAVIADPRLRRWLESAHRMSKTSDWPDSTSRSMRPPCDHASRMRTAAGLTIPLMLVRRQRAIVVFTASSKLVPTIRQPSVSAKPANGDINAYRRMISRRERCFNDTRQLFDRSLPHTPTSRIRHSVANRCISAFFVLMVARCQRRCERANACSSAQHKDKQDHEIMGQKNEECATTYVRLLTTLC